MLYLHAFDVFNKLTENLAARIFAQQEKSGALTNHACCIFWEYFSDYAVRAPYTFDKCMQLMHSVCWVSATVMSSLTRICISQVRVIASSSKLFHEDEQSTSDGKITS